MFIPNPNAPTYVNRNVPKNEFNPQARRQEQGEPQHFNQQRHVPRNHDRFQTFVPRPLTQLGVREPHQSNYQQAVGAAFHEAYDLEGPKPFIEVQAKEP